MTPPEKPEWIQIAEAENASSPRKISKSLPIMAFVVSALIIGAGAVLAQTQDESPANAVENTQQVVQSSPSTPTSQASQVVTTKASSTQSTATPSKSAVAPSTTPSVTPSSTSSGVANPSIGTMPTGGEGDEGEGDEGEGDHHSRKHGQDGEHDSEGEDD